MMGVKNFEMGHVTLATPIRDPIGIRTVSVLYVAESL